MNFNQILETAAGWAWGPPMLVLLVGTHLYLTIRLRFIQRYLVHAIRISLQRGSEGAGDVSHFGALTTALAATVGTATSWAWRRRSRWAGRARCCGCG